MSKDSHPKKQKLIVVTGPTASGKSALALEIAKDCCGEIICADSRSVYKDFDIVSAKPMCKPVLSGENGEFSTVSTTQTTRAEGPQECDGVLHHLLDIVTPGEDFSVENFKTLALRAIEDIFSRGGQPIICGGTWFYISTLLGLMQIAKVPPNEALRNELEKKSNLVLFDMLLELNERRAREIEPNNRERVIRAIEIARHGVPWDIEFCEENNSSEEHLADKYEIEFIIKEMEREELYSRIDARVDKMIETGLEEEYRRNRKKYGPLPIFRATIGYGEFEENSSRDIAIDKIKQHTRNFAKRQMTWLRSFEGSRTLDSSVCPN